MVAMELKYKKGYSILYRTKILKPYLPKATNIFKTDRSSGSLYFGLPSHLKCFKQ